MTFLQKCSYRASALAAAAYLTSGRAFAGIFGDVPDIGGIDAGSDDTIRQSVLDVLERVLNFMALIAVIFIVVAGIRLVVSQGEEQEKDKAKKTIIYVIIGLVVILIASAIVSFVSDTLVG